MARLLKNSTARLLQGVIRQSRSGQANRPQYYRRAFKQGYQSRRRSGRRLVLVTGYTAIGASRWAYTAVDAVMKTNGVAIRAPDAVTYDPVFNPIESANDGLAVESAGVDIDGTDYPGPANGGTFAVQPIQGSSATSWIDALAPAAWIQKWIDDTGTGSTVWIFDAIMNQHDGTCPP